MYKIIIKEYFDTYLQETHIYKENIKTIEEAKQAEKQAHKMYKDNIYTKYDITIEKMR